MQISSSRPAERLYRLLLLLYPRTFRDAYCREMMQTFRACYREARQQGSWGLVGLWSFILRDLVASAFVEHMKRFFANTRMEDSMLLPQFYLDIAQRTDTGRKRPSNEDSMTTVVPEEPQILAKKGALFVVSDGLGGHSAGDVASEMAVRLVSETYYQNESAEIATALQQAVEYANNEICHLNELNTQESKHAMGTTCVAAVLQGAAVYVANVGDSRAYILRDGQLRQISRDHSPVADMVRAGLLTEEQARTHEERNVINRSLGDGAVEVDTFTEVVQSGDTLILCTDGLSAVLGDEELRSIVEQYGPQESVEHLIARANEQGGPDNITAIVVRVSV
ncbi:MAG: Stp1/IreP family PP2C-type Ser/Thr phosphatase [Chloroflexota bacterium]|nr:Stp1/IreP family PP2C-type Ser/Thr phosphatase [Chloroflexota bacterium]